MQDACICMDVDCEGIEVDVREVRGGRDYRCVECGARLPRGGLHQRILMAYHPPEDVFDVGDFYDAAPTERDESDFRDFRTCLLCARIRSSLFKCGWYFGKMYEDIGEVYGWECVDPKWKPKPPPPPAIAEPKKLATVDARWRG